MNTTLRITCYRAADCGGSYLAFATPDESEFYALVAAIKLLGYAHAQWTPEPVKAWWLSPQGLARLCGRYPDLAWLIGEYERNDPDGGDTSGPRGSSDERSYTSDTGRGKSRRGKAGGSRRAKAGGSRTASAASGVPADVAAALAVLYVTPDAPVAVVKAVFRQMAKSAHPDTGGDHERMKHLIAAYELATTWAEAHGASLAGAA